MSRTDLHNILFLFDLNPLAPASYPFLKICSISMTKCLHFKHRLSAIYSKLPFFHRPAVLKPMSFVLKPIKIAKSGYYAFSRSEIQKIRGSEVEKFRRSECRKTSKETKNIEEISKNEKSRFPSLHTLLPLLAFTRLPA